MPVTESDIQSIGNTLNDISRPLHERFRALFTLKNLGGPKAIDRIAEAFTDSSALLKHELAYCLGQMQDVYAVPILIRVLEDKRQEAMVRHEAGEALGAIGDPSVVQILEKYSTDPVREVAETCELALARIRWLQNTESKTELLSINPFTSVDPAPPAAESDLLALRETLLNENVPLFERYRAMFALRNIGSSACVESLAEGLMCESPLFRHEIAYVLGQMQHKAAIPGLRKALENAEENGMVRHECAEALGSIAQDECIEILQQFVKDKERVVKVVIWESEFREEYPLWSSESCEVALDMVEYEQSEEFQYANGLSKLQDTQIVPNV